MQKMRQGRLVADLFLFFKKALCEVKVSGMELQYNLIALHLAFNKNKLYETLRY